MISMDRRTLLAAGVMSLATGLAKAADTPIASHPMRRKDRELTRDEALVIIQNTPHAVLATVGADGTPYAVPISPVWFENSLYFHTAATTDSLRYRNIQHNNKVSVCFVGRAETAADELPNEFSVNYASAIVTGRVSQIKDEAEKRRIATAIAKRQVPAAGDEAIRKYYEAGNKGIFVWKIDVATVTGKARNKQGYFNRLKAH